MFRHIRQADRNRNPYPKLSFPQLYVLKGGYEQFVHERGHLCKPVHQYLPMIHSEFKSDMRSNESRLAQEWKQLKVAKDRCFTFQMADL